LSKAFIAITDEMFNSKTNCYYFSSNSLAKKKKVFNL